MLSWVKLKVVVAQENFPLLSKSMRKYYYYAVMEDYTGIFFWSNGFWTRDFCEASKYLTFQDAKDDNYYYSRYCKILSLLEPSKEDLDTYYAKK